MENFGARFALANLDLLATGKSSVSVLFAYSTCPPADRCRRWGALVRQLNHPRLGCGYLCVIDYDRVAGAAGIDSAFGLGLAPGAQLWSWDFEVPAEIPSCWAISSCR